MIHRGKCLAVLSLIILVSSCGPTYYSDSFIAFYFYYPKIELVVDEPQEGVIYCFPADNTKVLGSDTSRDGKLFKRINEENGDCTYSRSRRYWAGFPTSTYPNVQRVDVTCDVDYDESHKAGESLNDIVMVEYGSYADFIKRGYVGEECKRIKVLLSEEPDFRIIQTEDLMFLLKFKKAPSVIPATYNIKVTVEYADGKLESDAIECTFSSAI